MQSKRNVQEDEKQVAWNSHFLSTYTRHDDDDSDTITLPAAVLNAVSNISEQDVVEFFHENFHTGKRLLIFTNQQTSFNLQSLFTA